MANLTIKDIARISGCSVSTISRVINDRPDVRPETKEHVLKVMREAGFVPNTNARQLKIQQSRSLVFVVKGTRNIFFSDFLVQLQRAATLYGYNGIVSYLDENANEIDAAEKILREIKPKGIIFLGGSVANFQRGFDSINVPSVLTTLVTDELNFPNLSMVGVDDRAAAYTALPGASFETDEDGYCRWYSDGHDAFYITGSYTLAEDGLAYRDDGPVYAAGFDPIPYDPAEDWGDSWMSNWG